MKISNSLNVLIIDDEPSIRDSLAAYLDDCGFIITATGTAEDALNIIQNKQFDAAIVDIRLPGLDGNTFITEAYKLYPEMLFLIHTGSVDYQLNQSLIDIGITTEQIFHKPFTEISIFQTVLLDFLQQRGEQS